MNCPRCNAENDSRSVCVKCGYFLYHPDKRGTRKLAPKELRQKDRRVIFGFLRKAGRIIWLILMLIVFTFWVFMIMYLFVGNGM